MISPTLVPDVDDDYVVVFAYAPPASSGGFAYALRGDRIVADFHGCGRIGGMAIGEHVELVPLLGGHVDAPMTNIAALDQITDLVLTRDSGRLSELFSYSEHACSTSNFPTDPLYCRDGEEDEESVDVAAAGGCYGRLERPMKS